MKKLSNHQSVLKTWMLKLASLAFLFYCSQAISQTTISGGEQFGTWDKENSPYHIQDDISIPNGQTLTIMPGVEVVCDGYHGIDVQGRLIASGNVKDSIFFTVNDTTGFYLADTTLGGWRGIWFDNTPLLNDTSVISYCSISYGKCVDSVYNGLLFLNNFSKILITNNGFNNNFSLFGYILKCNNSSPKIIANIFSKNHGCISVSYESPEICNNIFYNNTNSIIRTNNDSSIITNNTFVYNKTKTVNPSRTLYINTYVSKAIIENNIFGFSERPDKQPTLSDQTNTTSSDSAYAERWIHFVFYGEKNDTANLSGQYLNETLQFTKGEGKYTLYLKYNQLWTESDTINIAITTVADTLNYYEELSFKQITGLAEYSLTYSDDTLKYKSRCNHFNDSLPQIGYNDFYMNDALYYVFKEEISTTYYLSGGPFDKFLNPDFNDLDENYTYYLSTSSGCIDQGNFNLEFNDELRPPGLGTSRNDMGAYGGPYNYYWCAKPIIESVIRDTNVCEGDSIYFKITSYGNLPVHFEWYLNDINTGDTNNYISVKSVLFENAGNYKCIVTNDCGKDSVIFNLGINPIDSIQLSDIICEGESSSIGDSVYSETEIYITTLQNQYGCDSVVTLDLTVNPLPIAGFIYETNELEVTFINISENTSSYLWDFGDGNNETTENPIYTYASSEDYSVILTAYSNFCGEATDTQSISITTGINSIEFGDIAKIYPNPSTGTLYLEVINPINKDIAIEILDMKGQVIYSKQHITKTIEQIDLCNHAKGIYFIKLRSDKYFKIKKLIIE